MRSAPLSAVVVHADRILRVGEFDDWEGAQNGLQMENRGRVTRLAAAVDASLATVRLAIAAGADLLVVHHGLFWNASHPWTGAKYQLLRLLMEHDLAVYSSHLPLDAHPKLGNNIQLCAALGLPHPLPFLRCKGRCIGFESRTRMGLEDLAARFRRVVQGPVRVLSCGPPLCRRVGVVSGAAGAELRAAAADGVDTLITGEGPHWTFAAAEEIGLNVLYGGHYATETFGVKALAAHLSKRFGVPWIFLDHPSGL